MEQLDTNNINLKYEKHGRVKIFGPRNRIVYYEAIGPFNEELMTVLMQIEHEIISILINSHKSWGVLIEFKSSCLATNKTLVLHAKHIKESIDAGYELEAVLL